MDCMVRIDQGCKTTRVSYLCFASWLQQPSQNQNALSCRYLSMLAALAVLIALSMRGIGMAVFVTASLQLPLKAPCGLFFVLTGPCWDE
jgi:hypothetical protein